MIFYILQKIIVTKEVYKNNLCDRKHQGYIECMQTNK